MPTELVVHGTKYQLRSGEKHLRSRLLHRSLNWMHLGVLGMPCAIIGPLAEIKDFLVYVAACILAVEVSCLGSKMLNVRLQANCSNVRIVDTNSEGFLVLCSFLFLICCKMAAILFRAFSSFDDTSPNIQIFFIVSYSRLNMHRLWDRRELAHPFIFLLAGDMITPTFWDNGFWVCNFLFFSEHRRY